MTTRSLFGNNNYISILRMGGVRPATDVVLYYCSYVNTMPISDFKDSIIRDRQKGSTYQSIADRFGCSRQHIQQLLSKWGATETLVPTQLEQKQERALETVQLLIDGKETNVRKAARHFGISNSIIRSTAKKNGVDLVEVVKLHRAKEQAHRLDGQQFNGLKIVDGTGVRETNGDYFVEAICVVCGTRKVFSVKNLRAGYSKTCSRTCATRFKKDDYKKTPPMH